MAKCSPLSAPATLELNTYPYCPSAHVIESLTYVYTCMESIFIQVHYRGVLLVSQPLFFWGGGAENESGKVKYQHLHTRNAEVD